MHNKTRRCKLHMVISGRSGSGDARTHSLPLAGIYKGIFAQVLHTHGFINLKTFVHMQNLAFVRTYTFGMKSTESFINEVWGTTSFHHRFKSKVESLTDEPKPQLLILKMAI